ncbi:hypothetical protein HH214_16285 [Mucilaginibacter robiniae]|uniref:Uncharacterized protein n=1 Tax=Mucilaginibacter robiniae TaxID=2728022 RepID=A0A7L5E2E4_9SPHI|nr:hypothetical protein [Mucilaginibacter robiniae]QJD97315.1 hypothetical protein HH214_16285 [Mucilaginibacter robiniae]
MNDKLSKTYLFERHTQQQVTGWAARLHYFYFFRAWGGHANDGDEFTAGISYTDKEVLKYKLIQLGFTLRSITADDPQPEWGKSYPGTEFAKFKIPISHFPELEQPGHVVIDEVPVFVWVTPQIIQFSVSGLADGNRYEVSQADFDACLKLEKLFDQLVWQSFKDERITQSAQCISTTRYPELFI